MSTTLAEVLEAAGPEALGRFERLAASSWPADRVAVLHEVLRGRSPYQAARTVARTSRRSLTVCRRDATYVERELRECFDVGQDEGSRRLVETGEALDPPACFREGMLTAARLAGLTVTDHTLLRAQVAEKEQNKDE